MSSIELRPWLRATSEMRKVVKERGENMAPTKNLLKEILPAPEILRMTANMFDVVYPDDRNPEVQDELRSWADMIEHSGETSVVLPRPEEFELLAEWIERVLRISGIDDCEDIVLLFTESAGKIRRAVSLHSEIFSIEKNQ